MNARDLAAAAGPDLAWTNRFAALGDDFHTALRADPLPDPHWIAVSEGCARDLGWPEDWWSRPDWNALAVFSGHALWPGMRPLATVYSGHQFGVWAGQLGDGRALLLGEVDTPAGPMELQLKGSGQTPYSRMADGRAVLRSTLREFLCSEAMHALGVPTTRALCMTGSALPVVRETVETAAVVTRVAPSFVRFGHFEHFAHHGQPDALRRLADFVIDAHLPACRDAAQPYAELLRLVTLRTAELIADWQALGFMHGVINTDNMSILGLTIDYGPFGFMDGFDPMHVCNHSDPQGRYAYARQPQVAYWNLHALAQALLPLIGEVDAAAAALEPYRGAFPAALQARLAAKLGLVERRDGDDELVDGFMRCMAADRADFTLAFRRLALVWTATDAVPEPLAELFADRAALDAWCRRYRDRLRAEGSDDAGRARRMNAVNPKFVLRNHLAEVAIRQARDGEFGELRRLHRVLQAPFDEQPEHAAYAAPAPAWARELEVSCSS